MKELKIAALILAAGHGVRMNSALPKVMHAIGGRAMIAHVIDATIALSPERVAVVIGDHSPEIGEFAKTVRADIAVAIQSPPKGTAHAVMQALPALSGFAGAVLVLYADTPLVTPVTLTALTQEIAAGAAVAVLGSHRKSPAHTED